MEGKTPEIPMESCAEKIQDARRSILFAIERQLFNLDCPTNRAIFSAYMIVIYDWLIFDYQKNASENSEDDQVLREIFKCEALRLHNIRTEWVRFIEC